MKKILFVIALIIICQASADAQVKRSAKKNYDKAEESGLSIHRDIDSASYYLNLDHYKSLDFIEKGLKLSFENKAEFTEEAGKLYEILGDIYIKLEQYDLAIKNYLLAQDNYESVSVSLILKLIESNVKFEDFKEAKRLLAQIPKKDRKNSIQLEIYKYQGDLQLVENGQDSAFQLFNKGLDLSKSLGLNDYVLLFENRIAKIYAEKGDIEQAKCQLEETFSNTLDLEPSSQIQQAETNAVFYRENNELEKEVRLRQQSIDVLNTLDKDAGVQKEIQYQNLQIADAYIEKLNYKKAIPYLKKSINPIDSLFDLNIEVQATRKLSAAYEKTGNYNKALDSYRKYVELTDKLYREKEMEIEEAVSMTKDLVDKQKRIDGLEMDRELSESKEEIYEKNKNIAELNYKRQKLLIYGLIGGLILALIAIFFFYKNNQQRKIANNLLALKALKSQMNPHFIFNALNSVNNYIALNDERKANKYITDFSSLMRKVLDVSEKDFISLQEEVDLISLYTKLEHVRFGDKFDYQFDVDESLRADELKIPPMLIQPFVENAVWHGLRYKEEKGTLKIALRKLEDARFTITISDDGVGREKSKQLKSANQLKRKSKGMYNVRERIKIIRDMYNQQIQFEVRDMNPDGSGTVVEFVFPFNYL